jgi:hypothetical protein
METKGVVVTNINFLEESYQVSNPSSYWNNKYFLLGVNGCLSFIIIPNIINLINDTDSGWKEQPAVRFTLLILSFLVLTVAWLLFIFLTLGNRRNRRVHLRARNVVAATAPLSPSSQPVVEDNSANKLTLIKVLESIMLISCCFLFSFVLLVRSSLQDCIDDMVYVDWSCNPYHGVAIFPMDTAFVLMLIPLICVTINKEKHIFLTVSLWTAVLCVMTAASIMLGTYRSIPILIYYVLHSALTIVENLQLQARVNQLLTSLRKQMEDTQKLLDNKKLGQMKDMVGNVAHDLKTVRFVC